MTRRSLLKYLLTTPLAMTMDVEKLLWIPGQLVSVPETFAGTVKQTEYARMFYMVSNPPGAAHRWMRQMWEKQVEVVRNGDKFDVLDEWGHKPLYWPTEAQVKYFEEVGSDYRVIIRKLIKE